jgi:uncharacterized protein with NRDE domain
MCTVSFVNANGKIIITSNRDEKIIRPEAIEPKTYAFNSKKILFPRDPKAGGTWFAVDEYSNVIVLLNGADEKHVPTGNYGKSRGLIVLEIIGNESPFEAWKSINLDVVEPFTLVLFENHNLYQLRWNGAEKNTLLLDSKQNYIWSSSTLYPAAIREKRAAWFTTFLDTIPEVDAEELLHFHRYTETENQEHGLVINRNESMKTLSITQTVINQNKVALFYYDLINKHDFSHSFIVI